jgi:NAD(P)-dependent dehydrogenase (short-subunit alcohol dehydrogenase family)
VIVVTGAGAGAGRAIAESFGKAGWRVALISRDAIRLRDAKALIERAGGEGLVLPCDVADATRVFEARDRVLDEWGSIDVWVNAAMATVVGPVRDVTPDEYRRVCEVTYLGAVHGTLAALEAMRRRDEGHIVQIGSALAYRAIPLQSAYCACKFAIRGFTDSLRAELLHDGSQIRITMVQMPGMNTPQFDWARNKLAYAYQPVGDVFDPDVAADAVWRAIRDEPRELWVGGSAIEAITGQFIAPSVLDRYLSHAAWEGQISDTPHARAAGNLFEPVAGHQGARGRFGARAKRKAAIVDPDRLRAALAMLATLGAATYATLRLVNRR